MDKDPPDPSDFSLTPHQGNFDPYCWLACLFVSVFLIVWITLATGNFNIKAALFLLVVPIALVRAGGIVTAFLRMPTFFALDFLLGVALLSLALFAWKALVPLSLWIAATVMAAALIFVPRLLPRVQRERVTISELIAVLVSLTAATGWCRELIQPIHITGSSVVFRPWTDCFTHASIIARNQTNQTLFQVGNYEWKGFPALIYHYGSYSLAILLTKMGGVTAYGAAVGCWAPFGSFLSGLAAFAIGRVFWNQSAGLAALAGAFLMPDLALLNIGHPFYSYFWLQHIAPAGLYGVAIAAVALMLIVRGGRERRRSWIIAGIVAAAAVALFKFHVFAAEFPLLFSVALIVWPTDKPWPWLILGGSAVAALTLLALANRFQVGPAIRFDFSDVGWYWHLLARFVQGTPTESWYRVFDTGHPFPFYLPRAIGLLLISALGLFGAIAPVIWILAARAKDWQLSDGIALAAVSVLLLMTFGLSRNGSLGSAEEFTHRPFVWSYWLVSALIAGRGFSMIAKHNMRLGRGVIIVVVLGLVFLPFVFGTGLQRGKWPAGVGFTNLRVDRGFVDCAAYIRKHSPNDAVMQDSRFDKFLILGALGERPSFASRPDFWIKVSKSFREENCEAQLSRLQKLQRANNSADLKRSAGETGIRWYVTHPSDLSAWPNDFWDHPCFESRGYRVYDLQGGSINRAPPEPVAPSKAG